VLSVWQQPFLKNWFVHEGTVRTLQCLNVLLTVLSMCQQPFLENWFVHEFKVRTLLCFSALSIRCS
jgi:hypothetical protein